MSDFTIEIVEAAPVNFEIEVVSTGPGATVEIGTVETGDAGTDATVTNSGTANHAVLDFVIPKGDAGPGNGVADGDKGDVVVSESGTVWTVNPMVGDTGTGGEAGLVPAPATGDAAAGKYLKADGTWAVPPGGGGGDFLPLAGGTMDAGADIVFSNGSMLREGTTDLGLGGAGGISAVCSVGYELNFQSGVLTPFEQDGVTKRALIVQPSINVVNPATMAAVATINPSAADGTTPYILDTTVEHTSGGLLEVKNAGESYFQVGHKGNLHIGKNADSFGSFGGESSINQRSSAIDGDGACYHYIGAKLISGLENYYYNSVSQTGSALYGADASGSAYSIGISEGNAEIILLLASSGVLTRLSPTIADSSTPYLFDTSLAHTSGNLAEVKNNGTLKFALDYAGAIQTATIAAGQVTGLGTLATQSGAFSGTSSGTNTGDQDLSCLLVKSSNLSDLTNASTARSNLGLGSLATQSGTFSGASSGTNTGDQTNITGNAATVTTNANLTGPVTSVGNATTITDAAVTLAKMADLAQDQFIGRTTASTGVPQTATITSAARTVLDDTTVSSMVDTLGGASATGTGGLVRSNSPTLTTPTLGVASSTSEAITGTGGAGFLGMVAQSSAPAAPAGGFRQYADSTGRFSWIRTSDGFTRTLDAVLTANRVYSLPDASITFARTDAAQTFTGTQTFSGDISVGGSVIAFADSSRLASGCLLSSSVPLSWSSTSSAAGSADTRLTRKSAANIRQGSADAAAPIAQKHSVQSVVAGTSNTAGATRTFECSIGTGNQDGGDIVFQGAPAGSSGTAQNALVDAFTIKGNASIAVSKTITAGGTTGAQTINKIAGRVNFAAAATSLVVTNSLVTANSVIVGMIATNDATAAGLQVVAGAGSFTIYIKTAPTAETAVNFLVLN